VATGRRRKALQFLAAADEIMDLADDAADIGDAGRRAHALVDAARALPLS
jgi:phage terminase large subunit-like protein